MGSCKTGKKTFKTIGLNGDVFFTLPQEDILFVHKCQSFTNLNYPFGYYRPIFLANYKSHLAVAS